jgi:phospholipase A1
MKILFRGRHTAAAFFGPLFLVLALAASSLPAHASSPELDRGCVLQLAETADGTTTVAEIREQCATSSEPTDDLPASQVTAEAPGADATVSPVEKRLAAEREAATRPFSILAHKPNYFLAAAYNREGWNQELFQQQSGSPEFENDDVESQFQLSLKVPLAVGLFGDRMDLYGAYTNRSFWQVYNSEFSEPFRETNHEPELWAQFRNDWQVLGLTNSVNTFGWVHQSNGRAGTLSRSWNRLYANFLFERGHWAFVLKPWVWVSKDKEKSDNPDIDDYMGHGEFRVAYGRSGHVVSAMMRNQLESGFDRGAVELSWSFPVFNYPYLKGYVQYFYGYGESLIDYNHKVNRLGIGISITDWLD